MISKACGLRSLARGVGLDARTLQNSRLNQCRWRETYFAIVALDFSASLSQFLSKRSVGFTVVLTHLLLIMFCIAESLPFSFGEWRSVGIIAVRTSCALSLRG